MKAIFIFKNNTQPDMESLVYDQGGEMVGGFTLLESPDVDRIYQIETSEAVIEAMKLDTVKYEFIKLVEETV